MESFALKELKESLKKIKIKRKKKLFCKAGKFQPRRMDISTVKGTSSED